MPKRSTKLSTDDAIRDVALRFASEIAEIVRGSVAHEVTSQVRRVLDGVGRGARVGSLRLPAHAGPGDKRIGKTPVAVRCPAPGCRREGIRAKRNFCDEHAASIPEAEQKRLRLQQRAARGAGKSRRGR